MCAHLALSKHSLIFPHTTSPMVKEGSAVNNPPPPLPLWPLKEHYTLSEYASPSCIQLPTVQAAQCKIKPSTVNLLPSFYDLNNEDSYNHINDFPVICSTVRINNFSNEALKMFLFLFSLNDKSKYWLGTLPANSITTWAQLRQKFLDKYFSWAKPISTADPSHRSPKLTVNNYMSMGKA